MKTASALMDSLILFFAAWTLSQNLTYFLGGAPSWVPLGTLLTSVLGLTVGVSFSGRRQTDVGAAVNLDTAQTSSSRIRLVVIFVLPVLFLGVVFDPRLFSVAFLVSAAVVLVPACQCKSSEDRHSKMSSSLGILALVLGANVAVGSILVKAGDGDDFHYLAAAANVARNVDTTMASHYPILPYSDIPPPYPTFSLIAYHDLIGMLSYLTGFQPIEISSYFIAPIASFLIVWSYALCFRRFCPAISQYALLFAVAYLVLDTRHRGFGGFAFCRSWQGKSILLHVFMPMLLLKLNHYAETHRGRDALLASLVATCCVGLSSVSLWLIPPLVVAFLGPNLLAELRRRQFRAVGHTLLILWHPIVLIAWAYWGSVDAMARRSESASFVESTEAVLGTPLTAIVPLGFAAIGLVSITERSARLRFGCVMFVFALTFGNPLLTHWVAAHVTSSVVYWRVWWFLPLGLLFGLGAAGLIALVGKRIRPVAALSLLLGCQVLLGQSAIWNRFDFSEYPKLKMPERATTELLRLNGKIPETAYILAPHPHNQIIPTLTFDWHSMMPQELFAWRCLVERHGYQELYDRHNRLQHFLSGDGEFDRKDWESTLTSHPVNVVLHRSNREPDEELFQLLKAHGFSKVQSRGLAVWYHERPVPDAPFSLKNLRPVSILK